MLFFKNEIYYDILALLEKNKILSNLGKIFIFKTKKIFLASRFFYKYYEKYSELIRGEDLDFQTRLLLNNFNIFCISSPYFKYCMRKGSAVYKKVSSNIFEFLKTLEKIENYFILTDFQKNMIIIL